MAIQIDKENKNQAEFLQPTVTAISLESLKSV